MVDAATLIVASETRLGPHGSIKAVESKATYLLPVRIGKFECQVYIRHIGGKVRMDYSKYVRFISFKKYFQGFIC